MATDNLKSKKELQQAPYITLNQSTPTFSDTGILFSQISILEGKKFDFILTKKSPQKYNPIPVKETDSILRTRSNSQKGKLDFAKFCSWVGSIIEPSHGVYQPPLGTLQSHNIPPPPAYLKGSKSNPNIPAFIRHSHTNFVASFYNRPQIPTSNDKKDIKKIFIKKLFESSKSLKKGFFNMCDVANGMIDLERMKMIFDKWGFDFPEHEISEFFNELDQNKDGKITFAEFQHCLGEYIMPQQTLYFRQEYDKKYKPTKCIYEGCWDHVSPNSRRFCQLHSQLSKNKASTWIKELPQILGQKWDKFISQLELQLKKTGSKNIQLLRLEKLLKNYGYKLKTTEIDCILELCQDKKHQGAKRVSADPFLKEKNNGGVSGISCTRMMSKSQNFFNLNDELESQDQKPFGANIETEKNFVATHAKKYPLDQNELLSLIRESNFLAQIHTRLRKMDQQHSGLATAAQIQRIFSDSYPELQYYVSQYLIYLLQNFKSAIKKYQLQHNKLLYDYKRLVMNLSQKVSSAKGLKRETIPCISKSYDRLPNRTQQFQLSQLQHKQPFKKAESESQNQSELTPNVIDKVLGIEGSEASQESPLKQKFQTIQIKRTVSPFKKHEFYEPKRAITPLQRRNSQFVGNLTYQSQDFRSGNSQHMKRAFEQTSPDPYITPNLRKYQEMKQEKGSRSKSPMVDSYFNKRNHSVSIQTHSLTPKPSAQYLRNQQRDQLITREQNQKVRRLKQKLFQQWKIINRSLISQDLLGTGSINRDDLQRIIQKSGIYIDRDEWRIIFSNSKSENSSQLRIKKFQQFIGIPESTSGQTKKRNEKMINKLALLRANKSNIMLKKMNNASTISAALTDRTGASFIGQQITTIPTQQSQAGTHASGIKKILDIDVINSTLSDIKHDNPEEEEQVKQIDIANLFNLTASNVFGGTEEQQKTVLNNIPFELRALFEEVKSELKKHLNRDRDCDYYQKSYLVQSMRVQTRLMRKVIHSIIKTLSPHRLKTAQMIRGISNVFSGNSYSNDFGYSIAMLLDLFWKLCVGKLDRFTGYFEDYMRDRQKRIIQKFDELKLKHQQKQVKNDDKISILKFDYEERLQDLQSRLQKSKMDKLQIQELYQSNNRIIQQLQLKEHRQKVVSDLYGSIKDLTEYIQKAEQMKQEQLGELNKINEMILGYQIDYQRKHVGCQTSLTSTKFGVQGLKDSANYWFQRNLHPFGAAAIRCAENNGGRSVRGSYPLHQLVKICQKILEEKKEKTKEDFKAGRIPISL